MLHPVLKGQTVCPRKVKQTSYPLLTVFPLLTSWVAQISSLKRRSFILRSSDVKCLAVGPKRRKKEEEEIEAAIACLANAKEMSRKRKES